MAGAGAVGRRVARGSSIPLARGVAANLIALLGSIVVARILGPEEYGLASIALIYPGMAVTIAGLGLGQALTRFSSAESARGRASEYIYSGLPVSALSATAASLAVLALAPLLAGLVGRPGITPGIRILSIYAFSITMYSALEAALPGLGYRSVLWGLSTGYLAGVILYTLILPRRAAPARPSLGRAWELLAYSLPLYIPTLIASPVSQAIAGFLASRASDFEMGNLSVANLLTTPIGILGAP